MQLRNYQTDAVTAIYASLRRGQHPVAQLATGTGKSLIIADVLRQEAERGHRAWVLTHAQQLVKQNAETYYRHTQTQAGIVCAGLSREDYGARVIFGTIQSMIGPAMRGEIVTPELIIIDEAHRVSHKTGEQGMYGSIFHRHAGSRRLAMTATPWRTDNGLIYGDDPDYFWFNSLAYKYTVPQAVAEGYLSPLVGVETDVQLDLKGVSEDGEDFNQTQAGERVTNEWLTAVAASLLELARNRKHVALYAPTVAAAMRAQAAVERVTGWRTKLLTGAHKQREREEMFRGWAAGEFKVLCSVDTLTTGFDFPALDCIACLRPTLSSSLWVQIQGRGTRLSEGKRNCLLLDYAGNLQRLGGVDMLETYVKQRDPHTPVEAVEPPEKRARAPRRFLPGVRTLTAIDPLTGAQATDGALLKVTPHSSSAVALRMRNKVGAFMLMRTFECTTPEGARITASTFIYPELPAAKEQTEKKLREWGVAATLPVKAKVLSWQSKTWPLPSALTVKKSGKYWNITTMEFNK